VASEWELSASDIFRTGERVVAELARAQTLTEAREDIDRISTDEGGKFALSAALLFLIARYDSDQAEHLTEEPTPLARDYRSFEGR